MLIGEVAARSGVSARMLRHYESLGLLAPELNASGFRDYSETDVQRILHIEGLRSLGLSLQEVAEALHDPTFSPDSVIAELIRDSRDRLRAEQELLQRLRAVKESGVGDWHAALEIVDLMRALRSPVPAQRQLTAFNVGAKKDGAMASTLAASALRENNLNVEGALAWAVLHSEGDAVAAVARGLKSADVSVRLRALRIIVAAEAGELRTSKLLEALRDSVPEIRAHAALALSAERGVGDVAEAAAVQEVLISMVLIGVRDVEAAEALAKGEDVESVLSRFAHELRVREHADEARSRITQALAEFPRSTAVVSELLETLSRDKNPKVAFTARAILAT